MIYYETGKHVSIVKMGHYAYSMSKKNNRNVNKNYFTNEPKYLFAMISHNDCITIDKVQYDENNFRSYLFTPKIKNLSKNP